MQLRERPDEHLHRIADSLRRIIQSIRLSSAAVHDKVGVTGAQLFALQQLAARPGASLRELAERTLTDQSSISVVAARLVEAGYVARRVAEADARRIELTVTASGRALLKRAPKVAQSRMFASLRRIPAEHLRVAAAVLDHAAHALSPGRTPPPMFFEPPATGTPGTRSRRPAVRKGRSR